MQLQQFKTHLIGFHILKTVSQRKELLILYCNIGIVYIDLATCKFNYNYSVITSNGCSSYFLFKSYYYTGHSKKKTPFLPYATNQFRSKIHTMYHITIIQQVKMRKPCDSIPDKHGG